MSGKRLNNLTDDQLLRRFVEISLAQGEALLLDKIAKYNHLFDQKTAVRNELKSRGTYHPRFEGKVLDHADGRGFFLRDP